MISVRNLGDRSAEQNHIVRRTRPISLAQWTFDDIDRRDRVLDESGARTPSQLGILFESEDIPSEHRGQSRLVSRSGTDDERGVRAGNCRRLQQPGGDHRRHQVAPAAERQILIDVGDGPKLLGHKQLAPYAGEGIEHADRQ